MLVLILGPDTVPDCGSFCPIAILRGAAGGARDGAQVGTLGWKYEENPGANVFMPRLLSGWANMPELCGIARFTRDRLGVFTFVIPYPSARPLTVRSQPLENSV